MMKISLVVLLFAAMLAGCGTSQDVESPEEPVVSLPPIDLPPEALSCLPQPTRNDSFTIKPVNQAATSQMRIESIMPPGQSGHFPSAASCLAPPQFGTCALPNQSPESYGPHVDDQRLPYWNSQFKPGEFLDITGLTPEVTIALATPGDPVDDTIEIYRDGFGVPSVHANTEYGVWYGAGYAMAQDRLFLIDGAVRLARGTSGEAQGAGGENSILGGDVATRTLTYSQAEYDAIEAGLSARATNVLNAHADGINRRVGEVNALTTANGRRELNPELPHEFVALNYDPEPITTTDILALGVLMTRFVASAGGDEMENVKLLQALEAQHGQETGRQIFQDVLWVDDKNADVTIPDAEFTNISTPENLRQDVFEAAADFAAALPLDLADGPGTGAFSPPAAEGRALQVSDLTEEDRKKWPVSPELLEAVFKRWAQNPIPRRMSASYMMVASEDITADGSTLLVNGPQLGFSYPTLLVELEVHGAGYDARGSTVAGLPVVGIGYGERTVWGLTTGESKTIDSFIVELDPNNPNRYLYNGEFRDMDCRVEVVDYRTQAGVAPNIAEPVPGVNSVDIEVCRTVHGPVVARSPDNNLARAVEYGMWMREIETIEGVLDWNRVDTFPEFFDAMSRVSWNENLMYADIDGNIAYFHPGLHPWRHPSFDQRLPARGDGSQDHCDLLTFANTPKSINPERGYLHNWNNKPSTGWGDGVGGDAFQEPGAQDGRNTNWGTVIRNELDGDGLTHSDLVEMDRLIGRMDERAAALLAPILACDGGCGLNAELQALIDVLQTWDGLHYRDGLALDLEPTANQDQTSDEEFAPPAQQPDGVRDSAPATIFEEIISVMVDEITADVLPQEFIARHKRRGTHPYDVGTFHKLLAKLLNPAKSTITPEFDWLEGRTRDEFVADTMQIALATMQDKYESNDPAQFRRIHARSPICHLANPLAGPCLTMPHQDRGSWLKLVGFVPEP